jgi:pyruvate kinase
MTGPDGPSSPQDDTALLDALVELREAVANGPGRFPALAGRDETRLDNLAHYLALRHHDIRPLQRGLMWRGLSSLGRLESRVLPSLDAAICSLSARIGHESPYAAPTEAAFFAGAELLKTATAELFGPARHDRRTRIMVTLPTEAADDASMVLDLAQAGMDVARINCAHDDREAWRRMAQNVAMAGEALDHRLTVFMDIAGPKIRTDRVVNPDEKARLMIGDRFRVTASGEPRVDEFAPFAASVTVPGLVERLMPGDRVLYNDAKLEGEVETSGDGEAVVLVSRARAKGVR